MKFANPGWIAWAFTLLLHMPLASAQDADALTAAEARQIALDAYIYGYPLVTMEMTRRVMTNVTEAHGTRAPMGHLVHMRSFPTAASRDVTAPNADTLYTTTWLDVGKHPWILSLPDMQDRYFLFPMLDGWTEVFQAPGTRTTGTGAQTYAITGPGWKGTLPPGVVEYHSPTSIVWLLGRIYCDGTPEDFAKVHQLQDQVTVVPLPAYGKPYTPPAEPVDPDIDMTSAVRHQVNRLGVEAYFNLLATLMKDNPPTATDAPLLARMASLGIVPGKRFKFGRLDAEVQQALQDVPRTGVATIMAHFKSAGTSQNGWVFTTGTGSYGTDYLRRALITASGLGANLPQDAVYPTTEVDAEGNPYDGAIDYVLHFAKGQMPPVNGFWSLTLYDEKFFFVDNPLNRYTLSARNSLNVNADGSVDIYLQHENPGPEKESNWLPAPAGKFIPMLRLYWPKEIPPSIIDGSWKPPAIKQAD